MRDGGKEDRRMTGTSRSDTGISPGEMPMLRLLPSTLIGTGNLLAVSALSDESATDFESPGALDRFGDPLVVHEVTLAFHR
ncbi:hypothetical protein HAX54_019333 [Datura stramonium]|uniref:Uncharacterized protein n=1 Tax=Datura stramonium TaxID=4076 RepID=A0ABS8UR70_DATST|nr:hypothetical protein [Datura stramonium]